VHITVLLRFNTLHGSAEH